MVYVCMYASQINRLGACINNNPYKPAIKDSLFLQFQYVYVVECANHTCSAARLLAIAYAYASK